MSKLLTEWDLLNTIWHIINQQVEEEILLSSEVQDEIETHIESHTAAHTAALQERVKELEESKAQDLSFLIEIRDRFKKSHLDVVQREYVEQMLSDWIAELEVKK